MSEFLRNLTRKAMIDAPSLAEVETIGRAYAEEAGLPFPTVSEAVVSFVNTLKEVGYSKEEVGLLVRLAAIEVQRIMAERATPPGTTLDG